MARILRLLKAKKSLDEISRKMIRAGITLEELELAACEAKREMRKEKRKNFLEVLV